MGPSASQSNTWALQAEAEQPPGRDLWSKPEDNSGLQAHLVPRHAPLLHCSCPHPGEPRCLRREETQARAASAGLESWSPAAPQSLVVILHGPSVGSGTDVTMTPNLGKVRSRPERGRDGGVVLTTCVGGRYSPPPHTVSAVLDADPCIHSVWTSV